MMTCIVRAKLCELVGELLGLRSRDDLFLVGMLSAMDAILGRPIAEILPRLGLDGELQDAILLCADLDAALTTFERPAPQRASALAPVLGLVLLIERARWRDVDRVGDRLGLPPAALAGGYRRAVSWSESLVGAV
jgi:EAL and modified HD-GYP domain-containing signal transduction protein